MCYARRQRLSWARIKLSKYVIYTKVSLETYQSWFCSSYFKELVVSLLQFKNSKEFSESLFVLLFNFQGASRYRFSRQLCYYIKLKTLCQYFFKTFFKFFQTFFQVFWSFLNRIFRFHLLAGGFLLYLFLVPLSTLFLNFFRVFLHSLLLPKYTFCIKGYNYTRCTI